MSRSRWWIPVFFGALAILLFAPGGNAGIRTEDRTEFERANTLYQQGDFEGAAEIYEKLTRDYPDHAGFFYNLGNTYFRLDQRGQAILAYERARERLPRNSDIRHNLEYVRELLEYHIEDSRNWYLRAAENGLKYFTEEEISFLFFSALFLFMGIWVYGLFYRRGESWGWKRKVLGILLLCLTVLFAAKHVQVHVIRDAIVTRRDAAVHYGPSRSDQVAFHLGEDLKVSVVDTRQDWSRILLNNGESGWIRNSEVAEVSLKG